MISLYSTCLNMFKSTLHFLPYKTHESPCLHKIGLLLFLDLQMLLFYIYIMPLLILTQWCYLLFPSSAEIPHFWSDSSWFRSLDFKEKDVVEVTTPRWNEWFFNHRLDAVSYRFLAHLTTCTIQHLVKHHTSLHVEVLRLEDVNRAEIIFSVPLFFLFKLLG